jgi:thiol-disulfide isomerase/thioredoxin
MQLPSLLAILLAALTATASPTSAALPAVEGRGRITWFEGTYEQALAEAARSDRILFLDFWTSWCPWCQSMARETYTDLAVAQEFSSGIVCLSLDAESVEGRRISASFGVQDYPSLLFLEPDGSPRDAISGYVTAPRLRSEVQRIKRGEETVADFHKRITADPNDLVARICLSAKLRRFARTVEAEAQMNTVRKKLERGEGYARDSIESRWAVASKLREVGELELYREQADAILRLDRQRKSLAARSIAIYDAIEHLRSKGEDAPLRKLLKREKDSRLLFDGWRWVAALADERVKAAELESSDEDVAVYRREGREARKAAWPHCPLTERALFSNNLAWAYWQDRANLSAAERTFALEVATVAQQLEPNNVLLLDTFACCLWMNGRKDEAQRQVKRCIELDPENKEWRKRLTQLTDSD